MALARSDRLLTIVVTATLTSAAWILVGSNINGWAEDEEEAAGPVVVQPSPIPVTTSAPPRHVTQASELPASETATLMIPVLNVSGDELTDSFSDERSGGDHLHEAIDIMAPLGTSVVAAAPGVIERLFNSQAGGNTIYIRSQDGRTINYYAHLREYAPGLREGQRIRRGQRLGTVGSSGNADPAAPHLHFAILRTTPDAEWWEPSTAVNPYPLLVRDPPQ